MRNFLSIILLATLLFSSDAQFEMGKKIYKTSCVSCHGAKGSSDTDTSLIVEPRVLSKTILTQEQSYQVIKKGAHYWGASTDIMPAFESVYSQKELYSVAYYISKAFNEKIKQKISKLYFQSENIFKDKQDEILKRGEKVYKKNCSLCHGIEANGDGKANNNPAISIYPYALNKTLLDEKQIFLYAKYGGKYWGSDRDAMPSWSKKYDDFTLKSVAKYINDSFIKKR